MALLDDAVGYMAIGVWLNCLLFSWELVAVVQYFRNFQKDTPYIKLLVIIALINDIFGSGLICYWVYDLTVTGFGNMMKLAGFDWKISALVVTMGISAFLGQAYLVWRFDRVSKFRTISAILAAATLVCLGYSCYCSYVGDKHQSPSDRHIVSNAAKVLIGIEVGTDLAIAGSLIFFLLKHYLESQIQSTKALLLRLMLIAAESGLVTSVVTLVALLLFVYKPNSSIGLGLGFAMSRIYTLTLLFNLSIRQGGRTTPSSNEYGSGRSGSGSGPSKHGYSSRSQRDQGVTTIPVSFKSQDGQTEDKEIIGV